MGLISEALELGEHVASKALGDGLKAAEHGVVDIAGFALPHIPGLYSRGTWHAHGPHAGLVPPVEIEVGFRHGGRVGGEHVAGTATATYRDGAVTTARYHCSGCTDQEIADAFLAKIPIELRHHVKRVQLRHDAQR